jgi:hypothetical protein
MSKERNMIMDLNGCTPRVNKDDLIRNNAAILQTKRKPELTPEMQTFTYEKELTLTQEDLAFQEGAPYALSFEAEGESASCGH